MRLLLLSLREMRHIATSLAVLFLFFAATTQAANCFCKDIGEEYTIDCCQGCHGELREAGDMHCHFDEYSNMGDFNRCCDSYSGKGRCTLG